MTLWDHLFGTYVDPLKVGYTDIRLGLGYDQDFFGTLTAGRLKISERLRNKYRIGAFCYLDSGRKLVKEPGTKASVEGV